MIETNEGHKNSTTDLFIECKEQKEGEEVYEDGR